jgi:hypothetical protein
MLWMVYLFVIVFLVSVAMAHIYYLLITYGCGYNSSLVKTVSCVADMSYFYVVVGYLMRFIYLDMWLCQNCVESVSLKVMWIVLSDVYKLRLLVCEVHF